MKNKLIKTGLPLLLMALISLMLSVSDANSQQSKGAVITIKTGVEGLYDISSGFLNKDAELDVYLKNAEAPFQTAEIATGFINKETLTGTFTFKNVVNGQYYLVLKSKNTIETWSRKGGELIKSGTKSSYDFTCGKEKAFGDNLRLDGSYKHGCLYTGDVNQDGIVNESDQQMIHEGIINFLTGDVAEDLNGDNRVTLEDLLICYNNTAEGIKAITPVEGVSVKDNFTLKQNSPNPFNPITNISFEIPEMSNVKLSVFDITGREVALLVNSALDKGSYSYDWNASNYSSGTYFYRVSINGVLKTMKMNLIK